MSASPLVVIFDASMESLPSSSIACTRTAPPRRLPPWWPTRVPRAEDAAGAAGCVRTTGRTRGAIRNATVTMGAGMRMRAAVTRRWDGSKQISLRTLCAHVSTMYRRAGSRAAWCALWRVASQGTSSRIAFAARPHWWPHVRLSNARKGSWAAAHAGYARAMQITMSMRLFQALWPVCRVSAGLRRAHDVERRACGAAERQTWMPHRCSLRHGLQRLHGCMLWWPLAGD